MRIAFIADQVGFEADEYALVSGVAGGDQWLTIQRDAEDSPEDHGIHLEYSGQGHSGYGCVAACRLTSKTLSIDLGKQLGALADVSGFDVSFRIEAEDLRAVRVGLRRVFRGHSHLLVED